ncbi:MAG: hypothetical protein HGA85_03085 [Nanoarchaeota archaeon]|nr:hypothetical protein [Nanoarchaeota archaeon]
MMTTEIPLKLIAGLEKGKNFLVCGFYIGCADRKRCVEDYCDLMNANGFKAEIYLPGSVPFWP